MALLFGTLVMSAGVSPAGANATGPYIRASYNGYVNCGYGEHNPVALAHSFWTRARTRTYSGASCSGSTVTATMEARSAIYRQNGGTPLLCGLSSLTSGTSTQVTATAYNLGDCKWVGDNYLNSTIHGGWISGVNFPASGMFPMTSNWEWLNP